MWIVLLDHSGSMGDGFVPEWEERSARSTTRLEAAKGAFLAQLKRLPGEMLVAAIAFDDEPKHLLTAPAGDAIAFERALAELNPEGGTDVAAALHAAAETVRRNPLPEPPRILLISDGKWSPAGFESAASYCRQLGATIDVLLIGETESDSTVMADIARATGGRSRPVTSATQLQTETARSADEAGRMFERAEGQVPEFQSLELKSEAPSAKADVVRVLFATDRARTGVREPNLFFAAERGPLIFGTVEVSIPRRHRIGRLEGPKLFRLEFSENSDKHIMLQNVKVIFESDFIAIMREEIAASKSKQAFVFVHGYNVTFKDAARRAAQIHCDLGFDGPPILYSWPSQGRVKSYFVDSTNSQWTISHMEQFLRLVARTGGAETVHLIAHSMGNRPLVEALSRIATQSPVFREVILTAPDIDTEVFMAMADKMREKARRVTLYASARDRALMLSKKFNGYPRVGDASSGLASINGVDVIDATAVDTSFLGHSYFGDTRTVLSDLYYVLRGENVENRAGIRRALAGSHWIFAP